MVWRNVWRTVWCREKMFACFWVWYNKWFDTMCEEPFVAVKKHLRQQGVRSSFGRAMLSSLFCLEIMLFTPFRAWVDAACDTCVGDCCRADCIAHWCLSFASCKRALSLQHTIFHVQLCHTQLFTYNLFYFSILHHLLCLSFLPRPRYNICCSYWKKLTCGVIRSFNFLPALQCHLLMRLPRMRLPCETKVDVTKCHACQSAAVSPATNRAQARPSAPPDPAQCHKCHACHAKRR